MSETKYCKGCELPIKDNYDSSKEYPYIEYLCDECDNKYDNKTGYCSLDCCLGLGCDESC